MVHDEWSDECLAAFNKYCKDTAVFYNRPVSANGTVGHKDEEWYHWQDSWAACCRLNFYQKTPS